MRARVCAQSGQTAVIRTKGNKYGHIILRGGGGRPNYDSVSVNVAEKELEKAVQLYPKYAVAWFELGRIRESRNEVESARKAYGEALGADAKFVKPYHQLAGLSLKEQNWQDVADTTGRLIKLDPVDYADAYFYNSVANYYLKNLDAAEKSVREAQKLDTRNQMPKTNQLLGVILAEKQDFAGAAENRYSIFGPVDLFFANQSDGAQSDFCFASQPAAKLSRFTRRTY